MTIHVHKGDLPAAVKLGNVIAVDCEMMGLDFHRDRLCLVQLSDGQGDAHLVQIAKGQQTAPRLQTVMEDRGTVKIFHYARLDLAYFHVALGIAVQNIYCTKTASRLVRTFTDKHGLKYLVKEILGQELIKDEQSSDWGADTLTDKQKEYAASDVLYLHKIKAALDTMLKREGRMDLARACFDFLPNRALLDISGWNDIDIFAHH
jgi:ribonuclease D